MKKSLSLIVALGLASSTAFAGTTGTEFQDLYDLVHDWATGWFGHGRRWLFGCRDVPFDCAQRR